MSDIDGNKKSYKAVTAFVMSTLVLIWADLSGKEEWATLGFEDWTRIIVPAILIAGGVWAVPNPSKA